MDFQHYFGAEKISSGLDTVFAGSYPWWSRVRSGVVWMGRKISLVPPESNEMKVAQDVLMEEETEGEPRQLPLSQVDGKASILTWLMSSIQRGVEELSGETKQLLLSFGIPIPQEIVNLTGAEFFAHVKTGELVSDVQNRFFDGACSDIDNSAALYFLLRTIELDDLVTIFERGYFIVTDESGCSRLTEGKQLVPVEKERPEQKVQSVLEWLRHNSDRLTKVHVHHFPSWSHKPLRCIPTEICRLSSLTLLSLGGHHFVTLPDSFGLLKNLITVELRQNELCVLPDSLGSLCSLEVFDVIDNCLKALPDSLMKLARLRTINVSWNEIETLPDSLCQIPRLASLCADNNKLISLPDQLGRIKTLYCVDVSYNRLTEIPDSLLRRQLTQFRAHGNPLEGQRQ